MLTRGHQARECLDHLMGKVQSENNTARTRQSLSDSLHTGNGSGCFCEARVPASSDHVEPGRP